MGSKDPMLEMYIFETLQLVEQLEEVMLQGEKSGDLSSYIDKIFRNMHTIKGNSAMMLYENIAGLAHSVEDLFDYLRQNPSQEIDYPTITDLVLMSIDFFKEEIGKIKDDKKADGDVSKLVDSLREHLKLLKGEIGKEETVAVKEAAALKADEPETFYIAPGKESSGKLSDKYEVIIHFSEGCGMENIRAFTVVHNFKDKVENLKIYPEDIESNEDSEAIIRQQGFKMSFETDKTEKELREHFSKVAFLDRLDLRRIDTPKETNSSAPQNQKPAAASKVKHKKDGTNEVLSINVARLDELMDLIGELVISEAMVTKNPELKGLQLDSFEKAARRLEKIINNIQDTVMAMRLVPLSNTFRKMNRLVRDMSKKLGKKAELVFIGEHTEVDKNVIEHISDPLMHLIRNSMDHGIETPEVRASKGKSETGTITLEAKNAGGDVWIILRDDGAGLNKEKIYKKAREHGLVNKSIEELSHKEIYHTILLPGFSTKEKVTEYSGRGVGMDVVLKNIEEIRGAIYIDSEEGKGTTISIKIPLTLAIVEGMNINVGKCSYTIPITSIKESFKVGKEYMIKDPDGNEIILVRGQCYPVIRLYEFFNIDTDIKNIEDGIMIMVEDEGRGICLFADGLLGVQQVVVKALPSYIKKVKGIAGCTLLGDGSISLIIDAAEL
ncbi:MAG: chemotaxis protein CheA [Bacillota bacterium]|nr:chemotaxis protein CheA [Bacillota bacterium]